MDLKSGWHTHTQQKLFKEEVYNPLAKRPLLSGSSLLVQLFCRVMTLTTSHEVDLGKFLGSSSHEHKTEDIEADDNGGCHCDMKQVSIREGVVGLQFSYSRP